MRKVAIAACSIVFLLPFAAHAVDIDYPALGVKLTALPASAKTVYAQERFKGYEAQASFGPTTKVQIFRFDESVRDGNIADPAYRDALLKQFGIQPGSSGTQLVATVAGRPAWVVGASQQLVPGAVMAYYCNYYLVVSQHFYWIDISAFGAPKAASSDFDAAATNIATGLVFEPVRPQPEKPLAPGEMPAFLMGNAPWHYPDSARRLGEQGVVKVEFTIGGDGTAQDVKVTSNAGADLAQVAVSMLKDGGFKVPQGWQQSAQTFTMEWHFKLDCPASGSSPEDLNPQVMTMCASVR
ncbi:MAG: energy transducer TonB [Steroidobacteraceae bacterium]